MNASLSFPPNSSPRPHVISFSLRSHNSLFPNKTQNNNNNNNVTLGLFQSNGAGSYNSSDNNNDDNNNNINSIQMQQHWDTAKRMLSIVLHPQRRFEDMQKINTTNISSSNNKIPEHYYSCEEVCNAVRSLSENASEARKLREVLQSALSDSITSRVKEATAIVMKDSINDNDNNIEEEEEVQERDREVATSPAEKAIRRQALCSIVTIWVTFIQQIDEISNVWMYLSNHRSIVSGSIYQLGERLFEHAILYSGQPLCKTANQGFLDAMAEERECEETDNNNKNILDGLKVVVSGWKREYSTGVTTPATITSDEGHRIILEGDQVLSRYRDAALAGRYYHRLLEPAVLRNSLEYFTNFGNSLVDVKRVTAEQFVTAVEALREREFGRVVRYLQLETKPKLSGALHTGLIRPHIATLFDKNFAAMVKPLMEESLPANKNSDNSNANTSTVPLSHRHAIDIVTRAFQLMQRTDLRAKAKTTFRRYIESAASAVLHRRAELGSHSSSVADHVVVSSLTAIRRAALVLVDSAFATAESDFRTAMREALEAALRSRPETIAELLSSYMDACLRSDLSTVLTTQTQPGREPMQTLLQENPSTPVLPAQLALLFPPPAGSPQQDQQYQQQPRMTSVAATTAVHDPFSTPTPGTPLTDGAPPFAGNSGTTATTSTTTKYSEAYLVVQEALSKALALFSYLSTKDLFEALYQRDYAKRLVTQRSSSPELERFVMRRLKMICGHNVTAKLEGMLRDLEATSGMTKEFQEAVLAEGKEQKGEEEDEVMIEKQKETTTVASNSSNDNEMNDNSENDAEKKKNKKKKDEKEDEKSSTKTTTAEAKAAAAAAVNEARGIVARGTAGHELAPNTTFFILSEAFWPYCDTFIPNPTSMPASLQCVQDAMVKYYSSRFDRRRLNWVPSLSRCLLRATYNNKNNNKSKREYMLHLSLLQGLILSLCFGQQGQDSMTVQQIINTICKTGPDGRALSACVGVRTTHAGAVLSAADDRSHRSAGAEGLSQGERTVRNAIHCALLSLAAPRLQLLRRGEGNSNSAEATTTASNNNSTNTMNGFSIVVRPQDVFTYNPDFCPNINTTTNNNNEPPTIYVSQVQIKEAGSDAAAGSSSPLFTKTSAARSSILEALLLHALKRLGGMTAEALLTHVQHKLVGKFPVDLEEVKARLERLMEKQFVVRDDTNVELFKYNP